MDRKTEETKREVLTVRIPADLHQQLRAWKYFTGRSINELATELLSGYLAGGGRKEISKAMTDATKSQYADALRKLAEL
jgi:hypothetical protein